MEELDWNGNVLLFIIWGDLGGLEDEGMSSSWGGGLRNNEYATE